MQQATAVANPNIALIKYWGNRDDALRLPANGSISFSLAGLETITRVRFDEDLTADQLTLNHNTASDTELARVSQHLDLIRHLVGIRMAAEVESSNNFPAGTGIASSASAFAALTAAAVSAAGVGMTPEELSRLARRGSGSAARSIHPGFVELLPGETDEDSFARSIAPPGHWALVDLIAVVSASHKPVGSTEGHRLADSSPLQDCRVRDAPRRLALCRQAIMDRDFDRLAAIVEQDSNLMHAVMMTSQPPLVYWQSGSIELMRLIPIWRAEGLEVCYTLDAGPNIHCITSQESASEVESQLRELSFVTEILQGRPGDGVRVLESSSG